MKIIVLILITLNFFLIGCAEGEIEVNGTVIKKEIVEASSFLDDTDYFVVVQTFDNSRILVENEALYFKADIDEKVYFTISSYSQDISNDTIRYIYDLKILGN